MLTIVDRLAGNGEQAVKAGMLEAPSAGIHAIVAWVDGDTGEQVTFDLHTPRVRAPRPIGKLRRYPALDRTVIQAVEVAAAAGRRLIV